MKIILIAKCNPVQSLNRFSGIACYYIVQELKKHPDIELINYHLDTPVRSMDFRDVDHILGIGVRPMTLYSRDDLKYMKGKIKGMIAQTHDSCVMFPGIDLTMGFRGDTNYIGWAADASMFYPRQTPGPIRILIDHDHYAGEQTLIPRIKTTCNCVVDRLSSRSPYSYPNFATRLGTYDFFVVTHKESLGQVCLEAAMSGCLPIAQRGLIPDWQDIKHYEYEESEEIDIEKIPYLAPEAIRASALKYSWESCTNNIIKILKEGK